MSDLQTAIEQAKEALSGNNAKKALKILKPFKKSLKSENSSNVILLETFADAYLENGQVDKAYPLLSQSCELDPNGTVGGASKFFTLGQITGGQDGINILAKGIENISTIAGDTLTQEQTSKIVSGLLSMIEIWMTDLCMEPNAEEQCEELIGKVMEISENKSPEGWLTLGSIRISQQRYSEACEAFGQSWNLFEAKKQAIGQDNIEHDDVALNGEYVELLQPLLGLAKMCIEVGLYDIALKVVGAVKEIDEDNLEAYYLEGFTFYLISKVEVFKKTNPSANLSPETMNELNQHIQELPLDLNDTSISENISEARIALSFAENIGKLCDPNDEISQEIVQGTNALLSELGGSIEAKELQKLRKGEKLEGEEDLNVALSDISDEED
ncbi:Acl4p NDAI_0J00860 [Naumovozyma dairenensis CBS 421]|uniref:Assembly chaperone of RPL4 n=1 Tax=Naumovozyma dairenensis (strain ATCC 10597 / BCRC 20456 / CBS 421 / NBRC 0211 / NRRL Y-12639) TaxID=1071378 RepID=G0WGQ0_NAUDC|nr:hypothetical protein NDAI_0J00860 [Naumovozyma dairenensis CBS 421]CCD26978.1 hypothetical protein NDAI_0J00860 [Naumovozyma dairenensis CBS 421]